MSYELRKASEQDRISLIWSDNGILVTPGFSSGREGYCTDYRECSVFNEYVTFQKWTKKWWDDNRERGNE